MKFKRILSTALTVVMVFTALLAVMPVNAFAAYTDIDKTSDSIIPAGSTEANLTEEELKSYLENDYLYYNFNNAEEMLAYELTKGYLYCTHAEDSKYSLYINKYTGFVYYVNNITGQILTSNPVNPGYTTATGTSPAVSEPERKSIMSQVLIYYREVSYPVAGPQFSSYSDAALRNQISVSSIPGGLRVNYTFGDTTARFLLPGYISEARFMEAILTPMIEKYENMLEEYIPDRSFSFFEDSDYTPYDENGHLSQGSNSRNPGLVYFLNNTASIAKDILGRNSESYKAINNLSADIKKILINYSLVTADNTFSDKDLQDMYENYPITKEGYSIYVYIGGETAKESISKVIKKHAPSYTFAMMYEDEEECLYKDDSAVKPVFRCALEYTLNGDGTLSVSVPANSITYDDTRYILEKVTTLQYFGAGDMSREGYIFYPDGSGAVVEFDDFYNEAAGKKTTLTVTSDIYGGDNCYSEIKNVFREQITMPVFGIVNEVNTNPLTATNATYSDSKVTNGHLAILEEGESLSVLEYRSGGTAHKFATVFASYIPRSNETLSGDDLNSSGIGEYFVISESKYAGAYTTRYVMLCDEEVGNAIYGQNAFYESSYVGMAAYYRDYLESKGVLKALELASEQLPLYLEVFGSMDITAKVLSFPVTKSIPLTSFENVQEIYSQLSDASSYIQSLIDKYTKLAAEETKEIQKLQYQNEVDRYTELLAQVTNIKNINFKLTGFANGGMSSTYPTKIKWQKSCGGNRGFKELLSVANEVSAKEGYNFGIYPEFDFMYIHATSSFDGISNKGNVSKKLDNRYASKLKYNNVNQDFETDFTMLVSSDVFDKFYSKFLKKYSKYDVNGLSVSTLGSNLNSDFNKKDTVNREESKEYVVALLERMTSSTEKKSYDLMIEKGNAYALKYASHILDIPTDSSHMRYASHTVPFIGLVLHSYVNYTGSPINYSGDKAYDILRSIENGASLYYILCYQNTSHLKEDKDLSRYYGVDYQNWYDGIIETYTELNNAIGNLQDYKITDHKFILSERVLDESETEANMLVLKNEIIALLETQIIAAIDAKFDELQAGGSVNYGKKIDLTVDRAALIAQFADILNLESAELDIGDFKASLDSVIAKYETEYSGDANNAANTVELGFSAIEYQSDYSFITDSFADDKNYVKTKYTVDNGNVSIVTYSKGTSVVRFVLNYNNYSVNVRLDANTEFEVPANGYVKLG